MLGVVPRGPKGFGGGRATCFLVGLAVLIVAWEGSNFVFEQAAVAVISPGTSFGMSALTTIHKLFSALVFFSVGHGHGASEAGLDGGRVRDPRTRATLLDYLAALPGNLIVSSRTSTPTSTKSWSSGASRSRSSSLACCRTRPCGAAFAGGL
jgi:hypothetical protein